jgi:hypothetical protein
MKSPTDLANRMSVRRQSLKERSLTEGKIVTGSDGWARQCFTLPRDEARAKASEMMGRFPKAAYDTQIERWRVLPGDHIEFVIKRLPTAD